MTQRLRPRRSLFTQGMLAWGAFSLPLFIVLYFVTVPSGPWVAVIALQVIVSLAILASVLAYRWVFVRADADGITERGYFGRLHHVPRAEIAQILLVPIYHGGGLETVPQLFVCDGQGRQVLRMRGQYWPRESMEAVAAATGVPLTVIEEPFTPRELLVEHPRLLYWFERRPVLAAAAFASAFGGLSALVYAIVLASGFSLAD